MPVKGRKASAWFQWTNRGGGQDCPKNMATFKLNRYEVDLEKVGRYNADLAPRTLSGLIRESARRYGGRPFLGEKRDGAYRWMTYGEFLGQMLRMRAFLRRCGLGKHDRIAVIANNSVAFAMTAYAAYGLGAVLAPMYEVQALSDWDAILRDAAPKIAVVRNDRIRDAVTGLGIPGLETVLVIEPAQGETLMARALREAPLAEDDDAAAPEDVCDIIYTSGTTGRPRGVELTHRNVVQNVVISARMFDYGCEDRILSFLPWAHGFGKTVDLTLFPALGAAVGLAQSARTIQQDLLDVRPTVMCAVPKIFNRVYEKLHMKLEESKSARLLFERAQKVMHRARSGKIGRLERLEYRLMDRLVGKKVRGIFGGALKFCVSGGASLSPKIAAFFEDFGVRIFEGYGMTEHAPVIAINYNPDKTGSVGVALPTVKIEIEPLDDADADGKTGEIVISSECVMKGYRHDPEATKTVVDERGRLHTGDIGYLDDEGSLYIVGRIKEQYKLENGKFVVPSALEARINTSPDIEFSIVVGAGKPFNVALIHPCERFMDTMIRRHGLQNATIGQLQENPQIRGAIRAALDEVTKDLRGYEKPQRFAVILDDLTVESGLLTPALKIKRRAVEAHYAGIIQEMYAGD